MKILHMCSELDGGGIERLIYNYYLCMDHDAFRFDFLKVNEKEGILEAPLKELGCEIFTIPQIRKGYKAYSMKLKSVLKQGNYDAIHCHGGYRSLAALRIAKKMGVPVRIAHSHACDMSMGFASKVIKVICSALTKLYATSLFACGSQAAEWMWGKGALAKGKVTIINNAIFTDKFAFNEENRRRIRKELSIGDAFAAVHVGRLSQQKNQGLLIRALQQVVKKRDDIIVVLVGRGEDEEKLKKMAEELQVSEKVLFLGIRKDVADLLSAMDTLLLPSEYEGFPVTLVECQANGLPAIVSEKVAKEVAINENVKFLPLDESLWADEIARLRPSRLLTGEEKVREAGYDITTQAEKLSWLYFSLLEKRK